MSRWLKSVNTLLDKLDDGIENTTEDAAALAQRVVALGRGFDDGGGSDDDEESSYDEDDDDDDEVYDDEEMEGEEEEEEDVEGGVSHDDEEPEAEEEDQDYEVVGGADEEQKDIEAAETAAKEAASSSAVADSADISKQEGVVEEQKEKEIAQEYVPVETKAVPANQEEVERSETTQAAAQPVEKDAQKEPQRSAIKLDVSSTKQLSGSAVAPPGTSESTTDSKPKSKSKPPPPPPPPPPKNETTTTAAPEPTTTPVASSANTASRVRARSGTPTSRKSSVSTTAKNIPSPPVSAGTSSSNNNTAASAAALNKAKREWKKAVQENQRLTKLNAQLQQELEMAHQEMSAQHDELEQAAARMEKERAQAKETEEDLMDEQEEELQHLKDEYETKLAEQKKQYQHELEQSKISLQQAEQMHRQEGGDMTKELQDALARERVALKELDEIKVIKMELESKVTNLKAQQQELETKVVSLMASAKEAEDREREAEEKLDSIMLQHKRQLQLKQERESELERTVTDLGAALTLAQQKTNTASAADANKLVPGGEDTAELSYKSQFLEATEELESTKTQVGLLEQQREALQKELQDMSREQATEAAASQERQRQHENHVFTLTSQISKLETSLRGMQRNQGGLQTGGSDSPNAASSAKIQQLSWELEQARRELSTTTEQHLRQKSLTDSLKVEVLTLKGRLETATLRAENADAQMHELEAGGRISSARRRRRVRGNRFGQLPSRSLLSSFGMRVERGSIGEQVAITIDAVDKWMMETGSIMRHEPLARLGFAFYMVMVHLWCFCLVFFHTVEAEHGDLGNLTNRQGQK